LTGPHARLQCGGKCASFSISIDGYDEQARKYIAISGLDRGLRALCALHIKRKYKAATGVRLLRIIRGPRRRTRLYAGLSYMELGEKGQARARFETLSQKYPAMKETALALIHKLENP
jgi:hypothetical protein